LEIIPALLIRLSPAPLKGAGEKLPWQQRRKYQDRIGHAFGRQFRQLAEHQREYQHGQQWTTQRPHDADDGLLVAHQDIAPRQEEEQFAVAPQVAPVMALCSACLDDKYGLVG